jgi:3-oxoacyl-[acyl-carrier-protein] synthase II
VGEGAGFLVLETAEGASRRGARVLAEVIGYGVSNDASHISRPNPQGQVLAMRRALEGANLAPVAVGYVNANGTATQAGDVTESNAIKLVFGDHAHQMPVSATKSAHGHMMGAAGVVEFIAALMALRRQCVPPTTHWAQRDPDCDLDYVPGRGRPVARLRYVMSNSFAFGGNNVSLLARTPADLAGQRG